MKEQILEKYNAKWKAMRLHLPFMNISESDTENLLRLQIKNVLEVDNIGEYSDQGFVFDIQICFYDPEGDEEFILGQENDGTYGVIADYQHEYLGSHFKSDDGEISKYLDLFPFRELQLELQEEIMSRQWAEEKPVLVGQQIINGGYDLNKSEYFVELENGLRLTYKAEDQHKVQHHLES